MLVCVYVFLFRQKDDIVDIIVAVLKIYLCVCVYPRKCYFIFTSHQKKKKRTCAQTLGVFCKAALVSFRSGNNHQQQQLQKRVKAILNKVAKLLGENQGDDDDLRSVTRDHHKNACIKPVFYLFKNYDFPYLFFITTFFVCVYMCICV